MDAADFDELIEAIVTAAESIREARPDEPPAWLERFLVRNEEGELLPRTLSFRLPAGPGEEEGEAVEMSMLDLVPPVRFALASMSVELDCVLEEVPDPGAHAPGATRMMMSLRGWERDRREGIDRVRISVRTDDPVEVTAYVNGKPFKTRP